MQAFAEGFDILKGKTSERLPPDERFDINLTDVAPKCGGAVQRHHVLAARPHCLCTGAGRCAGGLFRARSPTVARANGQVDAAMEEAVPAYVLSAALFARYRSRVDGTFGDKVLSAMRFGFGGHLEPKK